jgi:hypothetical protein
MTGPAALAGIGAHCSHIFASEEDPEILSSLLGCKKLNKKGPQLVP